MLAKLPMRAVFRIVVVVCEKHERDNRRANTLDRIRITDTFGVCEYDKSLLSIVTTDEYLLVRHSIVLGSCTNIRGDVGKLSPFEVLKFTYGTVGTVCT